MVPIQVGFQQFTIVCQTPLISYSWLICGGDFNNFNNLPLFVKHLYLYQSWVFFFFFPVLIMVDLSFLSPTLPLNTMVHMSSNYMLWRNQFVPLF